MNNPRRTFKCLGGFPALCLFLLLLTGCTTPDTRRRDASAPSTIADSAAMLLEQADRARIPRERLGILVAAADLASQSYGRAGGDTDRLTYNQACAKFAAAWKSSGLPLPLVLQSPKGDYRIEAGRMHSNAAWNPGSLTEILLPSALVNQSLVAGTPSEGFGGVVVGVERPADLKSKLYPKTGISVPVTAVLNFERSTPGNTTASFTLYNPADRRTATVAGRTRQLASDLSAPSGYYPLSGSKGFLAMLRPGKYEETEGIYLLQPYDPDKIPLVFIHGLMSSPQIP